MRRNKVFLAIATLLATESCAENENGEICGVISRPKEAWMQPLLQNNYSTVNIQHESRYAEVNMLCEIKRIHNMGIPTVLRKLGCTREDVARRTEVTLCFDKEGTLVKKVAKDTTNRKLSNMMGRDLRVIIVPDYATFQVKDEVPYDGVDYHFLNVLAEKLNFTIQYVFADQENPKYANSTRTWPAAYDMLHKKEAELFISHIAINKRETNVVDFTNPYIIEDVLFCGKLPGFVPKAYNLIKPFELRVWIALIVAFFIFGFVLHQVFYVEYKLFGDKKPFWKETWWYLSSTILCQASGDLRRSASRVLMILWLSMIFILATSYSGILTSFMSLPIRYPPIDTLPRLEEAVTKREKMCITYKDSLLYLLITKIGLPGQTAIRESLIRYSTQDIDKLVELIVSGQYFFIGEQNLIELTLTLFGRERFFFSKDKFSTNLVAIAIRKGVPLKKYFDTLIQRINEAGMMDKWIRDLLKKFEMQYVPEEMADESDLGGTQTAFLLLAAGYIVSFLSLILEICVFKLQKR